MSLKKTDHILFFSNDLRNQCVLLGIWILLILLINPLGDFPLNDSWSYAKPVESLLKGQGIQYTGWMSMTLFTQVLWGALWCKIGGFSFTILRFSTLFLGGVGLSFSYKLLRQMMDNKQMAFVMVLLILFNPIYLNLSFTFMTEVPFYTTTIIGIFYYLKFLRKEDYISLFVGTVFIVISILIRQLSLVVPLALFLIGILRYIKNKEIKKIVLYFLPFAISLIIYFIYQEVAIEYFNASGRYNERNQIFMDTISNTPFSWMITVLKRNTIGALYIVLFISPIIVSMFYSTSKKMKLISVVFGSLYLIYLLQKQYIFPILDNIIYDFGLGPATLYDSYWHFRGVEKTNHLGTSLWVFLTWIISVLFAFLCIHTIKKIKVLNFGYQNIFIVFILLGYLTLTGSIPGFDRYYLFPTILVLSLLSMIDIKLKIVFPILVPIAWFSIAGTHDYLSWNRARWKCIDYLMKEKAIKSSEIDGGFEFNGWYNYNDMDYSSGRKNLWVHNVDYIIGFNKIEGTEIIFEEKYPNWLTLEYSSVKVLKKNENFKGMKEEFY